MFTAKVNFIVKVHDFCIITKPLYFPNIRARLAFEWVVIHLCGCFHPLTTSISRKFLQNPIYRLLFPDI